MLDTLRTRATLDWSPSRQDGVLPTLDGATYPQGNFDIIDTRQNYTASASADWVASSQAVRRHACRLFHEQPHDRRTWSEQPLFVFARSNIGFLDVPASLQQVGGFQTDLSNDVSRVDRLSRVNAQVDATFFGSLAGQHTLKAGLQVDRRSNDVDKGESANRVNLFWNAALAGQRGRYGFYRVFSNPIDPKRGSITLGNVSDTTVGLFVQDAWTVHRRLTINLGLRTENETVPFYSPVGRQGTSSRSISRSATSWRRGPERRGTSPVTADGRCTAAGACSTTSSSCPCRRRRSAACSRHELLLQARDV